MVEKKKTFDTACKLMDIGHTFRDSLHMMWPTSLVCSQTAILFQLCQMVVWLHETSGNPPLPNPSMCVGLQFACMQSPSCPV